MSVREPGGVLIGAIAAVRNTGAARRSPWQLWRAVTRQAEAVRRLAIDPHSPPAVRCNAVITNLDTFHEAFAVTEPDALFTPPQKRVRIW